MASPPYIEWSGYALVVLWGVPSVLSRLGYAPPFVPWLALTPVVSVLWLMAWYRARRRSGS